MANPIKRQKLYKYLSENSLTDLSSAEFDYEYSTNVEKSNKLYSYLSDNQLTDLSSTEFESQYFGDLKKKGSSEPIVKEEKLDSDGIQEAQPTSSDTVISDKLPTFSKTIDQVKQEEIPSATLDVIPMMEEKTIKVGKLEPKVSAEPFKVSEAISKEKADEFSNLLHGISKERIDKQLQEDGVSLNREPFDEKAVEALMNPEHFTNESKLYIDNKNSINEYVIASSKTQDPALVQHYDKRIAELKKENETTDKYFENVSLGKATYGMFWDSDKETATISDDLRLEMLNPTSVKEAKLMNKILSGEGKIEDKEYVIGQAKSRVLTREYRAIENAFKILTPEEIKDNKDVILENVNQHRKHTAEYVEENADRIKHTFGATKERRANAESLSGSPLGEIGSTFLNQAGKTFGKWVGSPIDIAKFIYEATGWRKLKEGDSYDESGYDLSDSMLNTSSYLADIDYSPESKEKFQLVDKDGNWDFSTTGVFKAAASSAPFMIGIMLSNQNRRKLLEGTLTYAKDPTKLKQAYGLIRSSAMLTIKDNVQQGIDYGMSPQQANAYGGFLAAMEGVTNTIMPDTKFLAKPFVANAIGGFNEAMKHASTSRAYGIAFREFSKKMALELTEEEAMLMATSLANGVALQDHTAFQDFFDYTQQMQTVTVTLALAGSMSTMGIKSDLDNARGGFYHFVSKNSAEYLNQLDELSKADPKQKKENDAIKLKVALISDAVMKAPAKANGEVIELIARKAELEQEKKRLDPATHDDIKAELETIDARIREVLKDAPKPKVVTTQVKEEVAPVVEEPVVETPTTKPILNEEIDASDSKGRKGLTPISELESFIGEDRLGEAEMRTSRETIDELKKDIAENGFKEPIVVMYDKNSNGGEASIVEGNHRIIAAKELGMTEIPVAFEKGTLRSNDARKADQMFPLNRKQVGVLNDTYGVKGADLGLTVRQPSSSDFVTKTEIVETPSTKETKTKEAKPVSEKLNALADALEKKRIVKSFKDIQNLKSGAVGAVAVTAWDGGVLVTSKAIRAGATLAKAIEDGLANVKSTKWYKGLSKESQDIVDARFYNEINDRYKEIDKVLKERDVYARVDVAETELKKAKRALKAIQTRLKNRDKLSRAGVVYAKKALTPKEFKEIYKKELNAIFAQIRDVKTDKGLEKLVEKVDDIIDGVITRRLTKEFDALLKTPTKGVGGNALLSDFSKHVLNALKGSNSLLNKTYSELDAIAEKIDIEDDATRTAIDIAKRYIASTKAHKNRNAKERIDSATTLLKTAIKEGRSDIKALRESAVAEKRERLENARVNTSQHTVEEQAIITRYKSINSINANTKPKLEQLKETAVVFLEQMLSNNSNLLIDEAIARVRNSATQDEIKGMVDVIYQQYSKEADFTSRYKNKISLGRTVVTALSKIAFDVTTMVAFIDKKIDSEMTGGFLQNIIADETRRATNRYTKLKEQYQSKVDAKLKSIYGEEYGIGAKINRYLIPSILENTNVEHKTNLTDLKGDAIKLSRSEAMWLYNQFKNDKTHLNFKEARIVQVDAYGVPLVDSQGNMLLSEEVTNIMTKEDKELADWMTDEFYPDMYPAINKVYRELHFTDMPHSQFYSGQLQYEGVDNEIKSDVEDAGWTKERTAIFYASGIERTAHRNPISTHTGAVASLFDYVDSSSRFVSSAVAHRNIKEVLNDSQVRDNIANYTSTKLRDQLSKLIDFSFGFRPEVTNNLAINALILGKIMSSLALTPKLFASQIMSSSLWLTNDTGGVIKETFNLVNLTRSRAMFKEIYANSAYIRERYQTDASKLESDYVATRSKIMNRYAGFRVASLAAETGLNIALMSIKVGDAAGIFTLGIPYYINAKKEGMIKFDGDETKAVAYAIDKFEKVASKTQQSYASHDRDLMQHELVGKVFNMYGNSPKQYFRNSVQAMLEINRGIRGKQYKGTIPQNAFKFVMNHTVQGMLYQWIGSAMVGLLSDDDEADSKMKDIFFKGAIFGSMSKFFIFGDIIEGLWDSYQGKLYATTSSLPMLSSVDKFKKELYNYRQAEDKRDEVKMHEHLMVMAQHIADIVGVPASKTKGLIENLGKVMDGGLSNEETILRLLNYSNYAIDNMNKANVKGADKRKAEKAKATRQRRSTKKTKVRGRANVSR